jgi:peptidoglycan/xylan/chitin deacetylase (PgdA/CDA1 family)
MKDFARTAMTTTSLADSAKAGLLATRWYAHRLEHDAFPGVLVLCYHGLRSASRGTGDIPFANLHVTNETFEAHCRLIADTCHPIDLTTFRDAQINPRALPARPVLVTFDDGYRSVFEMARPVLRRYRIPAAVFVCSDPVRARRLFWFDAVARAAGEEAVAAVRALPDDERRAVAAACEARADASDPLAPMTTDQVRQLADEGFAIGAHTSSHAPLGQSSPDLQQEDLESCRTTLESWTGQRVDALAYPWGAPRIDYTPQTVAIADALGFTTAFTTKPDFARPGEPVLERSRFVMLAEVSAAELAHRMAYAWTR